MDLNTVVRDRRKVECCCENDPEKCICWKVYNKNGPRTWYSGEFLEIGGNIETSHNVKDQNGFCKRCVKQNHKYHKKKQRIERIEDQYRLSVPKEDEQKYQRKDEVTKREVHWRGACGICSGVIQEEDTESMTEENQKEFRQNINKDGVKSNKDFSAYGFTKDKKKEAKINKRHKNKLKRKRRGTDWEEQEINNPEQRVNNKGSCHCNSSRCARRMRGDKIRDRQKKQSNWQPMYKTNLDSETEEIIESGTEESELIEGCISGKKATKTATNKRPSYRYKSKSKGKVLLPNEFQEGSDPDLPTTSFAKKSRRNYDSQSISRKKLNRAGPIKNEEINPEPMIEESPTNIPYNDQTLTKKNQSLRDQDNDVVNQKIDRTKRPSEEELQNENHQNKSMEQERDTLKTTITKQKNKTCCRPHSTAHSKNDRQMSISEILEDDNDVGVETCCGHNNMESCFPNLGKELPPHNENQKESTSYNRESKPTKIAMGPVNKNNNNLARGSKRRSRDYESPNGGREYLPTYDESGAGDEFNCYKDCFDQTYPEDTSPDNNDNESIKNYNRQSNFDEEQSPVNRIKGFRHHSNYQPNNEATSPDFQKIRGSYSNSLQSRSPSTNQDISERGHYYTNENELSSQGTRGYSRQTRFQNQDLSRRGRNHRHYTKREIISPDEHNGDFQKTRGDFVKNCGHRHIDCLPDEEEEEVEDLDEGHFYETPSTDHFIKDRRHSSRQELKNGYDHRSRIENNKMPVNNHFYETPSTDHFITNPRHSSRQELRNGYDPRSRIEKNLMPDNKKNSRWETISSDERNGDYQKTRGDFVKNYGRRHIDCLPDEEEEEVEDLDEGHFYETPSDNHFITDRRHSGRQELRKGYDHRSRIEINQMPCNNFFYETPSTDHLMTYRSDSSRQELIKGYDYRSRIEKNQIPANNHFYETRSFDRFIKKCGRRYIDCLPDEKNLDIDLSANQGLSNGHRSRIVENQKPSFDDDAGKNETTNQGSRYSYSHQSRIEENEIATDENWNRRHIDCLPENKIFRFDPTNNHRSRNEGKQMSIDESLNETPFTDHFINKCGRRHIDCLPDNKIIRFDPTSQELRNSYGHRSTNEENHDDESFTETPLTDHFIKKCGRRHIDCLPDEKVPAKTGPRNNFVNRSTIEENQMLITENWDAVQSTASTNHITKSSNRQHVDSMRNQNLHGANFAKREHYNVPIIENANTPVIENRNAASRLDQETKRHRHHDFNYLPKTGNEFQLSLGNWEANIEETKKYFDNQPKIDNSAENRYEIPDPVPSCRLRNYYRPDTDFLPSRRESKTSYSNQNDSLLKDERQNLLTFKNWDPVGTDYRKSLYEYDNQPTIKKNHLPNIITDDWRNNDINSIHLSAQRKQFFPNGNREKPVIDYRAHNLSSSYSHSRIEEQQSPDSVVNQKIDTCLPRHK